MKTFSNIHPSDRIPIIRTTSNSRKSWFSILPILNSIHMNWYVKWVFTNCLSKYSITKSAYIALNKTEILPVPIHGIHVSIHLIQPQFISLCITLLMPTNHHIFTHGNRNLNKPSKPKNMELSSTICGNHSTQARMFAWHDKASCWRLRDTSWRVTLVTQPWL